MPAQPQIAQLDLPERLRRRKHRFVSFLAANEKCAAVFTRTTKICDVREKKNWSRRCAYSTFFQSLLPLLSSNSGGALLCHVADDESCILQRCRRHCLKNAADVPERQPTFCQDTSRYQGQVCGNHGYLSGHRHIVFNLQKKESRIVFSRALLLARSHCDVVCPVVYLSVCPWQEPPP